MADQGNENSTRRVRLQTPTSRPLRETTVDVRNKDALEMLKLGEAVCHLQSDLRSLRLEKEDLRFERDRFKSSSADYQAKMVNALEELEKMRGYREEVERLRSEIITVSQEFINRINADKASSDQHAENLAQDFNQKVAALNLNHNTHIERIKSTLSQNYLEQSSTLEQKYSDQMRAEITSISQEFHEKLKFRDIEIEKLTTEAENLSSNKISHNKTFAKNTTSKKGRRFKIW